MFFHQTFQIGTLSLPHRLIQGPLAGYSCAPFRQSFSPYRNPAYCVSEMISAHDVIHKHSAASRYLFKSPEEGRVCYQLSGHRSEEICQAGLIVENLGADLIDINCGCPQPKIRKKGAGSALLEKPEMIVKIIQDLKDQIHIPLTIKIRIQDYVQDAELALAIEEAGADALVVHGRTYLEDYDKPCNYQAIAHIKSLLKIPVIANGDIVDQITLIRAHQETACDAYMISRAGCGRPWLYQELLDEKHSISLEKRWFSFQQHILGLKKLEGEFKTLLQSRSLMKYYFRDLVTVEEFYQYENLQILLEKLEHKVL